MEQAMIDGGHPAQLTTTRSQQIARYVAGARNRHYPPEVIQAAKNALFDIIGVSVGAVNDAPVVPVRRMVERWAARGKAQIFLGGRTTPALAALVNGTMGHAMDFDDAHTMGAGHVTCPCAATTLALASHLGSNEQDTLAAFITAFEVMVRMGGGGVKGVGRHISHSGFHPTSVMGRMGATAAACVLLGLDETRIERAFGVAATTAGGLSGSFGTHSKPFHGGKAAMDGILSAELAAEGFISSTRLLENEKSLYTAFAHDHRNMEIPPMDFDARWELLRNGFKPYASCRATHPAIQAARKLAPQVAGRTISRVKVKVHANALVTAGKLNPRTPLESKFSVSFCVALGLRNYSVVSSDFGEAILHDTAVNSLLPVIEIEAVPDQPSHEAYVDVQLDTGETLHAETAMVLGHPENPMSAAEFSAKFTGLVEPVLGARKCKRLQNLIWNFEEPGQLRKIFALLAGKPGRAPA